MTSHFCLPGADGQAGNNKDSQSDVLNLTESRQGSQPLEESSQGTPLQVRNCEPTFALVLAYLIVKILPSYAYSSLQ